MLPKDYTVAIIWGITVVGGWIKGVESGIPLLMELYHEGKQTIKVIFAFVHKMAAKIYLRIIKQLQSLYQIMNEEC